MVIHIFYELQQLTTILTLASPIDINVPTTRALGLDTKYSFVLFVTHLITKTMFENEEMIVTVNAIYAIASRSLKKIQDFNGV